MKNLLIIYRQPDTAESLRKNLAYDGYRIRLMKADLLDFCQFDPFGHDLVIIHLNLDVSKGWEMFLDFKKQFPYLPVLLYIRDLYSLKYAVSQVLRQKGPPRSPGYSRNSFFMSSGRRHLKRPVGDYAADNPETGLYQSDRYLKWIQWFSREWKTDASPFIFKNE